jgi:starch phosphorylase
VYFLDTELHENTPADRALTGYLYGGDSRYRLRQEALLGLGGIAMLRTSNGASRVAIASIRKT